MMFNPAMASTSYKPKTSRNPLARPKRPSGSGYPSSQAPNTQPLSPSTPVSPGRTFNTFPNFHGSENANMNNCEPVTAQTTGNLQRQESSEASTSEQVNQYLQNYEYGGSDVQDNGTVSAFFSEDPFSSEEANANPATSSDNADTAAQQESAQGSQEYRTEEEFNSAYYQFYQQNPPPGQWDAYKQQWEEYYRNLNVQQSQDCQQYDKQQNLQNDQANAVTQDSETIGHQLDDNTYQPSHVEVESRHHFVSNGNSSYPIYDSNPNAPANSPLSESGSTNPVSETFSNTNSESQPMMPVSTNAPLRNTNYHLASMESQSPKDRDSVTPLWDKQDLILPRSEDVDPEGNIIMTSSTYNAKPDAHEIARSRTSSSRTISENYSDKRHRYRTTSSTSQSHTSDVVSGGTRSRTASSNSFKNEFTQGTNILPPPQFEDPPQSSHAPLTFGSYGSAFAPLPKTDESSKESHQQGFVTASGSVGANYDNNASAVDDHRKTFLAQQDTTSNVNFQKTSSDPNNLSEDALPNQPLLPPSSQHPK